MAERKGAYIDEQQVNKGNIGYMGQPGETGVSRIFWSSMWIEIGLEAHGWKDMSE